MNRRLALAVLFIGAWPVFADEPPEPTGLALAPAAVAKPSLKYRLLPDAREVDSGNAATLYYRTYALFYENKHLVQEVHEDYWEKWLTAPLADLKDANVGTKLGMFRHVFNELELAGKCGHCDWQLERRREGIGLLLPDVQGFRSLARLLAVRARHDIAGNRPLQALASVQSGLALARHLGEGPSLVHVLVGAAIGQMICNQLELLAELPGAPNLYWALTTLPRPFLDPQRAVRWQSECLEHMIPGVKRLGDAPMSLTQVQAMMAQLQRMTDDFGLRKPDLANLRTAALIAAEHPAAKRYLLEAGVAAETVEAMPSFQAVALSAFRQYREAYDEAAKWIHVRDGFQKPGYKAAVTTYKEAVGRLDRLFFFGLLRGLEGDDLGLGPTYGAAGRLDRRLAALACVEALRHYAATHDGKLPAALADLTDTPAPDNPQTGKAFAYQLKDDVATLSAPATPGDRAGSRGATNYEISVRK